MTALSALIESVEGQVRLWLWLFVVLLAVFAVAVITNQPDIRLATVAVLTFFAAGMNSILLAVAALLKALRAKEEEN